MHLYFCFFFFFFFLSFPDVDLFLGDFTVHLRGERQSRKKSRNLEIFLSDGFWRFYFLDSAFWAKKYLCGSFSSLALGIWAHGSAYQLVLTSPVPLLLSLKSTFWNFLHTHSHSPACLSSTFFFSPLNQKGKHRPASQPKLKWAKLAENGENNGTHPQMTFRKSSDRRILALA